MQNTHQFLQPSGSQSPPEFRPRLEGRLFTAHDATVDASCEVHPTARLLYDSLPPVYREVFKNCPMYLEKHMEFVKFLKSMSKIDVTQMDADPELLRPLGIQIPTEERDKKKWQCGVVGCDFKDTLQHLYTHLQQKKHIGLPMFACQYCKRPFNRANDRKRHEVKIHGNGSSPQTGLSRSTRGISHHGPVRQIPTCRTRVGNNLNKPENRPPAYTDTVYNEDMSAGSDTPSSSEGDDQFPTRENSWNPPKIVGFDEFHDPDANKLHFQGGAYPFDSEGFSRLNQEPVEPSSATTWRPVVAIPAGEPAQGYGCISVPRSIPSDRYNHIPAGNPRPQAQSQSFFALPNQNVMGPASPSNGLMLQSTYCGNGLQGSAAPPVTPIQSTNNGGMHAQTINNNYHIHSPAKSPQFTGNNLDTQPLPMQWSTNMAYNPIYSQSHTYLQAPTLSQTAVYATPAAYAPSGTYYYYDYWHGPTNDTMHDLQQYQTTLIYPNVSGTRLKVPCTWMLLGPGLLAPCLHNVDQADTFKNRSLDGLPTQVQDHGKLLDESTVSPSGQQNASIYGERQANGYRISISGLRNSTSSNASCILPRYSSDIEKGIINQCPPPAISYVRGIKLFIICCLVALLLSVGLFIHLGWQFGGFTL